MRSTLFALSLCLFATSSFASGGFKKIADFCSQENCIDGSFPSGGLIADAQGNLFGTTRSGGTHNAGTVFELMRTRKKYQLLTLYNFCSADNCSDGSEPSEKLIMDSNGNLYGTTTQGGAYSAGKVFQITPTGDAWQLTTIHDFCPSGICSDGMSPSSGLSYQGERQGQPYDGTSALYGTTVGGGKDSRGVAYAVTPGINGEPEQLVVLHSFCAKKFCSEGDTPIGGVTLDAFGNVYGVTGMGGAHNFGVAYQIAKDLKLTVLHQFCEQTNCTDGADPEGALTLDDMGVLYGAARGGGTHGNSGAIFRIAPKGTRWKESVLYNFCSDESCFDGTSPNGGLVMDDQGQIYGTALSSGEHSGGTLFKIKNGKLTILHSFCSESGCSDGQSPAGTLLMDTSGILYGVTVAGGADGAGTVFELKP